MSVSIEMMTPPQRAMIWTLGALQWCAEQGWVGGEIPLLPAGVALYDQLDATGYRPERAEIYMALTVLAGRGIVKENQIDGLRLLVEQCGRRSIEPQMNTDEHG